MMGAKAMQSGNQPPLYREPLRGTEFEAELTRLAALHPHSQTISSSVFHRVGRNRLTRSIDTVLSFVRRYLTPLHWIWITALAIVLYIYARAVAITTRIVTTGSYQWPEVPKGSVLAIWHGSAPSVLAAFAARKPTIPVILMVSRDPRGDCVAVFCRWLGFKIVRGDAEHRGWKALTEIANELHQGAAALIAPDGNGPPFRARVGTAALASSAGVPLIPIGAYCRPSILERHKWDAARNPLPFGRIAIACGEALRFPAFENAESLEKAREQMQDALNRAADLARST